MSSPLKPLDFPLFPPYIPLFLPYSLLKIKAGFFKTELNESQVINQKENFAV